MKTKRVFITCWSFLISIYLLGQCPDQNALFKRLLVITGREPIDSSESQLEELTGYQRNCIYKHDSVHAFLLQKIGELYYEKNDYLKAIQYARAAIQMISDNAGKSSMNTGYLIRNYFDLGDYYGSLNKIGDRMNAIDSCILMSVKYKRFDEYYLYALWHRANFLFDIGDYHRCIGYVKMSINASSQLLHDKNDYYNRFFNMQVNSLLGLHEYESAEKLLSDQLAKYKLLSKNYHGPVYAQMAEVEISKKNYSKALSSYHKALQANREIHYDRGCLEILENIGYYVYYKPKRDINKALANYIMALGYIDPKNQTELQKFENLNLFTNIANVYAEKNNFDSAFYYFQLAFNQIKPGVDEDGLVNSPLDSFIAYKSMSFLTAMLIDKADVCLKAFFQTHHQQYLKDALRIYKVTDRLLDRIKMEQSEITSKLFWRQDSHRLYEHAIEASYLDHNVANAFYFYEKSRAVLLNDQLNQQSKTSSDDILAQAQVKKKMLQLKWEQDTIQPSSGRYAQIQNELFTNNSKLDELGKIIKEQDPLYYQSFLDTSGITLLDVRNRLLKDHVALLELFTGDSSIYALLITAGDVSLSKIDKSDFDSTANKYASYISNLSLLNRDFGNYINTANHLYLLIFQHSRISPGRIIISPDTRYFPFEALVTDSTPTSPVYFLADHAVSYTYSARYLLNNFAENKSDISETFLGVAPVRYTSSLSLPALQGSDLSLNEIGSYFNNSSKLIREQASKDNFLKQYSKYEIIQLYTHASESSMNGEPVIYFADSALYLSELIAENKPATRLVVLSACETANGQLNLGEGVFGFNRGFAALGIPSSITNLWSVDNKSTYRITENFYKYLSKGAPADVALQKAKLEFISDSRENKLPYYWAAIILTGKTEVFTVKKKNAWPYIGIVTAIFATLFFYIWRARKRRNQVSSPR